MTNFIVTIMPILSRSKIQFQNLAFKIFGWDIDMEEFMKETLDNINKHLWEFLPIDELLKSSITGQAIQSILELLSFRSQVYNEYWSAVNLGFSTMEPLGYSLITTFFIIYMFDLASKDQLTFDYLVKSSIQLIAVVAIAGNLILIINSFLRMTEYTFDWIQLYWGLSNGPFNDSDKIVKDIIKQWKDSGLSPIFALVNAFVVWVVHFIAIAGCSLAAISRALDIGWRVSCAPIGVANSFEGGSNSAGVRYLKGLLAAFFSGLLIFMVTYLGFALARGFLLDGNGRVVLAVVAELATAGAAIGISGKAKELIA